MADENQYTNPQNQQATQNQNNNDDFDMFGWNDDVFENPNLLQIEDGWKTPEDDYDDFDDDIGVDYREKPATQIQNTNNQNTNNDNPEIESPVFDEPDNPADYVPPEEDFDDIEEFDDIPNLDEIWHTTPTSTPEIVQKPIETTDPDDSFDIPNSQNDYNDLDDDRDDNIFGEIPEINTTNNNWWTTNKWNDLDDNDLDDKNDDIDDSILDDNTNKTWNNNSTNNDLDDNDLDETPQIEPINAPKIEIPEIKAPIEVEPNEPEIEDEPIAPISSSENTAATYEIDNSKSYVQNKFLELKFETKKVFDLVNKDYSVWFDLLWANDDRQKVSYKLFIKDNEIEIKKFSLDKTNEATQEHNLVFELKDDLNIYIEHELFYNETTDLKDDANKSKQVVEKFNKFIFLVTEEYKKIIKEKRIKEKNNIKKTIFREF